MTGTSLRIGSLFSGYGGLDLAALQLFPGSSVAWHCEWEKAPSAILDHHWPGIPNHHDVTAVDWDAVDPVDILTGGYPCQPFSAAGQRKGTTDERHLWPYVRAAVRNLRPRHTLLENVAGHRSLGFDRVLGDMAEDGMHVRWTSVRASDVGACHKRERLFILITPADASDSAGNGRSRFDDSPSSTGARRQGDGTTRGSTGNTAAPVALLPTPSTADGMGGHLTRSGSRSSELLLPGVAKAYGEGKLLPTVRTTDANGAGFHGDGGADLRTTVTVEKWGPYESAIARQERFSRPAPSPTEPNSKGNPRLAAEFAEWMMFLPAGHVTDPAIGLSRNDQLKAIGNGVCPPQAAAAYSELLRWSP